MMSVILIIVMVIAFYYLLDNSKMKLAVVEKFQVFNKFRSIGNPFTVAKTTYLQTEFGKPKWDLSKPIPPQYRPGGKYSMGDDGVERGIYHDDMPEGFNSRTRSVRPTIRGSV